MTDQLLLDPKSRNRLLTDKIALLLDENNLVRKRLPDALRTLARSLSDALYLTPKNHDSLLQRCVALLVQFSQGQLQTPHRVASILLSNPDIVRQYSAEPANSRFDSLTCELVAISEQVRVVVYTVTDDNYLTSLIINNGYDRTIEIVKLGPSSYEAVFSKREMDKFAFCQNLALNILANALAQDQDQEKTLSKDCNYGRFLNFSLETSGERSKKRLHKRIGSDDMDFNEMDLKRKKDYYETFWKGRKPPQEFVRAVAPESKRKNIEELAVELGFLNAELANPNLILQLHNNYQLPPTTTPPTQTATQLPPSPPQPTQPFTNHTSTFTTSPSYKTAVLYSSAITGTAPTTDNNNNNINHTVTNTTANKNSHNNTSNNLFNNNNNNNNINESNSNNSNNNNNDMHQIDRQPSASSIPSNRLITRSNISGATAISNASGASLNSLQPPTPPKRHEVRSNTQPPMSNSDLKGSANQSGLLTSQLSATLLSNPPKLSNPAFLHKNSTFENDDIPIPASSEVVEMRINIPRQLLNSVGSLDGGHDTPTFIESPVAPSLELSLNEPSPLPTNHQSKLNFRAHSTRTIEPPLQSPLQSPSIPVAIPPPSAEKSASKFAALSSGNKNAFQWRIEELRAAVSQPGSQPPMTSILSPYVTGRALSPYPQHQVYPLQSPKPAPSPNQPMLSTHTQSTNSVSSQMLAIGSSNDLALSGISNSEGGAKKQAEKKKPVVIEESKARYTGRLKFFDENKNFGFIIMDEDNSDIFVHFDDLLKANISKEALKTSKSGFLRLSFACMSYIGKYNKSRKAVDIQILPDQ